MKIKNNSAIMEDDIVGSPMQMMNNLIGANDIVLLSLMRGYKIAEAAGEIGISNSLQDRVLAHQKHRWMLNATVK
jgi:DNA-binding ferritin-like protein